MKRKLFILIFGMVIFSVLSVGRVEALPVVNCSSSADCAPSERCSSAGYCVSLSTLGCQSDADCSPGDYCDTTASGAFHNCKPGCRNDSECPLNNRCVAHQCIPGCNSDADCNAPKKCDTSAHICVGGCLQCLGAGDEDFLGLTTPSCVWFSDQNGKTTLTSSSCSANGEYLFRPKCSDDGSMAVERFSCLNNTNVDAIAIAHGWNFNKGMVCGYTPSSASFGMTSKSFGTGQCLKTSCGPIQADGSGGTFHISYGYTPLPEGTLLIDGHSSLLIPSKVSSACSGGWNYPVRCEMNADGSGTQYENDTAIGYCPSK